MNTCDLPRRNLRRAALLMYALHTGACSSGDSHASKSPESTAAGDMLKPKEGSEPPQAADPPAPEIRPAAHDAASHAPGDATPSPDGARVYYTAFTSDADGEERAGVFAVAADGGGGIQTLTSGRPLAYPVGISVSFDGAQLFVADRAAGDQGAGALLSASSSGGDFSVLAGTENYRPAGLTVALREGQPALYFTGFAPDQGAAGLFTVAVGGGVPQALASGDTFRELGGVAVAADGSAYVVDIADNEARVLRVRDGAIEAVVEHIGVGFPAGIALTMDDQTLLVSGIDPATRRDVVYVYDTQKQQLSKLTQTVGQFAEAAGLHRAHDSNVFAWADSQADQSGTVYLVKL
jgi:sugar lactone lactonase YvrE